MSISNISRVLGRIREIEALMNPVLPDDRPEPAERFENIFENMLEEKLDDPYSPPGEFAEISVPASVAERLAMWEPDLQDLSSKYGVDPDLARAVMRLESGGNPNAISSAGAIGLMQLMPGTAKGLGVDPRDPKRNLEGGIKYLAQLSDKYNGDYEKTLAAYNAGSGRVDSYGGIPPFPETERYVKNVLALYRKYSRGD
jgi:soluble lytic murein transglycosylase-like protein